MRATTKPLLVAIGLALLGTVSFTSNLNAMTFEMPKLPYAADALAPKMSKETIDLHYGKHLQTYVNNLNGLVPGTEFEKADLETIVKKATGPIFNNGAQVWNHTFFFLQFSPAPKATAPSGKLLAAINEAFGSFDAFKEQFSKAAVGVFGSGWAWLSKDASGKLSIQAESNAGNPLRAGLTPILTCDVWEHTYYVDYRNRRAEFVTAFWDLIDWSIIDARY